MLDLTLLDQSLTENDDLRLQIALFIEPEAWGDFSQPEAFAEFEPRLKEMVLRLFPEMLWFPSKTKEESLFLLLKGLDIRLPSSDKPACYRIVWDFIKRIRANPESVSAEQKVMFALIFPRWLRSSLRKKEGQVAHINAVLLQKIRSDSPAQKTDLKTQLGQWLFLGQGIYTVLSTLWRQGHVRLVLTEMLDKMESSEGELSLATEAELNRALQHCFIELKDFCQKHALRENSSLEELSKKSRGNLFLSSYERALELLVLAGVDLCHIDIRGDNLLHFAVLKGYTAMIGRLLATGIDANLENREGNTALHLAAYKSDVEVIEILLAAGVDPNSVGEREQTALHKAAYQGHAEVVELLIAAGVDADLIDVCEETALHLAASQGHVAVVKRLLAASVDANLVDMQRQTALHPAALSGHAEVVELLIIAGVDVNLIAVYGQTALTLAIDRGHDRVVELLQAASRQRPSP